MKLVKIGAAWLAVLMLAGCGKTDTTGKLTGESMTIRPTEFSAETKKVLDILDDEVMFFTYVTDESVQSISMDLWIYENGEWISAGGVNGGLEDTEQSFVLRVKDMEIDLIQIQENGQSKYTFPVTVDFSGEQMLVEERLREVREIVPEEEIVLYSKLATDDTAVRSEFNFREQSCSAGIALTVVFSETPAE